jgi:poly(3-hydroxybutyrate) depolymerase
MLYHLYELNHAMIAPMRAFAKWGEAALTDKSNPFAETVWAKNTVAAFDLFESLTRRYGKPAFDLDTTEIAGREVGVTEKVVWEKPFCQLLHFERDLSGFSNRRKDPTLLIVAPLSGHYATLLRGTVEALLPTHNIYITDWTDARTVPLSEGGFALDDYISYLIEIAHFLGPAFHTLAVCQPSVPVLAAAGIMAAEKDPNRPLSMTLMGGPIDTRIAPTEVNELATKRGIEWFERNVIMTVPFPNPGAFRRVYPGFLQLGGFMAMNLDRHVSAHKDYFNHLVEGDGDNAAKHREFYDEYLSVMDMEADYYLQTVERVFCEHHLPRGLFTYKDAVVDLSAIDDIALMTVEGEKDDISGVGQTRAAHTLCTSLPDAKRMHWEQPGVGHYGVFNGSRWRKEIAPKITKFIKANEKR